MGSNCIPGICASLSFIFSYLDQGGVYTTSSGISRLCCRVYSICPSSLAIPSYGPRLLVVGLEAGSSATITSAQGYVSLLLDDRDDNNDNKHSESNTDNDSHSHILPPTSSAFLLCLYGVGKLDIPHLLTDTVGTASETLCGNGQVI
jgi:hypothetical protein